jgi:hypothetical protein
MVEREKKTDFENRSLFSIPIKDGLTFLFVPGINGSLIFSKIQSFIFDLLLGQIQSTSTNQLKCSRIRELYSHSPAINHPIFFPSDHTSTQDSLNDFSGFHPITLFNLDNSISIMNPIALVRNRKIDSNDDNVS